MTADTEGLPGPLRDLIRQCEESHRAGAASLEQAYSKAKAVLEELEQLRLDRPGFVPKFGLLGRDDPYEAAVVLAYSIGHPREAFELAERARARGLLDRTLNKTAMPGPRVMDRGLLGKVADCQRRVRELTRLDLGDPTQVTTDLRDARAELLEVQQAIRDQDPAFSALHGITPASLEDLQSLINDGRTAVLVYYLAADRLIIFVVTRRHLSHEHVNIGRAELASLVRRYRHCVIAPTRSADGSTLASDDAEVDALSRRLYNLLVQPAVAHLRGKTRLGVIPHAELHHLPFQALRSESGYVIERFAVWYAPSISLLDLCNQRQRSARGRMLAMGNPDLGTSSQDLPSADDEVSTIAALFNTQPLTRKQASVHTLRERWDDADFLHLACHAEWDEQQPEFSALILAPHGNDHGRLEVHELFNLDRDLALCNVTLSGCGTSLGAGADLTGLATGFLYAGSPSVVASLWEVDDLATSELMLNFYHKLADTDGVSALQGAQLKLLKLSPFAQHRHPFFWAAFNVIGSSHPIASERPLAVSAFNLLHRWTHRAETGVLSHPSSADGMLFASWYTQPQSAQSTPNEESAIHAISLSARRTAWKRSLTGWPRTHCFTPGLVHVSTGDFVVALRSADGETCWQRSTGTRFGVSLAYDGNLLYVGGPSRLICALNPLDGSTFWEHKLDRPGSGGFAAGDKRVFIGCNDGRLYALDASDGRLCWVQDLEWKKWSSGPAWVAAGKLHTEIGLFDTETGRWESREAGPIFAPDKPLRVEDLVGMPEGIGFAWEDTHVLVTPDFVLATTFVDRKCSLWLFDRATCRLLRRYFLGRRLTGIARHDEFVIVGNGDGALQVFSMERLIARPELT